MEKTKKTSRKRAGKADGAKIRSAYENYLLTQGVRPVSVFKFCLELGITEDEFYAYTGSFDALEGEIWKDWLAQTIATLKADPSYAGFSVREKVLAFYYTLMEVLKKHRSYILLQFAFAQKPALLPANISHLRSSFETFIRELLEGGVSSGEVASRPGINGRYPQLFWLHLGFVLNFWREDSSAGFEQTDAAIEKSVNLAFDLIGKGAVDSTIDLAKFIYQSRKN